VHVHGQLQENVLRSDERLDDGHDAPVVVRLTEAEVSRISVRLHFQVEVCGDAVQRHALHGEHVESHGRY